jgi:hypothetical protein
VASRRTNQVRGALVLRDGLSDLLRMRADVDAMAFETGSKRRASMSALVDRRIEMLIEGDESRIDGLQDEIASTVRVWCPRSATSGLAKVPAIGDALIEPIEDLRR